MQTVNQLLTKKLPGALENIKNTHPVTNNLH